MVVEKVVRVLREFSGQPAISQQNLCDSMKRDAGTPAPKLFENPVSDHLAHGRRIG
jgi:hypothetical protein